MKTKPQQKRDWKPWYLLPELPICPDCQVACIVRHSSIADDGKRIQHRYCPNCRKPFKTSYRVGDGPRPVRETVANVNDLPAD
jgi:transposase